MTNTYTGQPQTNPLAETPHPSYPSQPYAGQLYAEPSYSGYSQPYVAAPAVDPGRTLGIAGLVLSIFTSAVGLVLSIIAFRKSKRAGFKNTAALAGIVIGAITTLGVLTATVAGVVAATSLAGTCADLGPGQHVVNGVTYTCG